MHDAFDFSSMHVVRAWLFVIDAWLPVVYGRLLSAACDQLATCDRRATAYVPHLAACGPYCGRAACGLAICGPRGIVCGSLVSLPYKNSAFVIFERRPSHAVCQSLSMIMTSL